MYCHQIIHTGLYQKMVSKYRHMFVRAYHLVLVFLTANLSSCIPYSILQRQEFQDKDKVAISCEWINKGIHFDRLVFCESELQYMVLFHQEPWLSYEKEHFQRYLSYLLKAFFKKNQLDLNKFQFSKIHIWIHAQTFSPENVTFFVQISDLLVHLPLLPKNWKIGIQNSFYLLGGSGGFPYAASKKLSLLDVELKGNSQIERFTEFIHKEFPNTTILKTTFPIIRLQVPVFLEASIGSKMYHHPGGKKLIKDIRPVSGPGVKFGDLKRVSHFSLYLSNKEKNLGLKKSESSKSR
ncbi:MAG: hypothetical protein AB8G05_18515 [Oligoflexales bacterium]